MTYKKMMSCFEGLGAVFNSSAKGIPTRVRIGFAQLNRDIKEAQASWNVTRSEIEGEYEDDIIDNPLPYNCPKCGNRSQNKYPQKIELELNKEINKESEFDIDDIIKFPKFTFEELKKYNLTSSQEGDLLRLGILIDPDKDKEQDIDDN